MSDATSRITAQGQTSVPAEIRRRLGVGPGSVHYSYQRFTKEITGQFLRTPQGHIALFAWDDPQPAYPQAPAVSLTRRSSAHGSAPGRRYVWGSPEAAPMCRRTASSSAGSFSTPP